MILGGNPVFTAPADLKFAEALGKVASVASTLSALRRRDVVAVTHWNVPEAHALEAVGDARATTAPSPIMQPLIAPLYGGKTTQEVARPSSSTRRPARARTIS